MNIKIRQSYQIKQGKGTEFVRKMIKNDMQIMQLVMICTEYEKFNGNKLINDINAIIVF